MRCIILLALIFSGCTDIIARCPTIEGKTASYEEVGANRVYCYYVTGNLTCPQREGWTVMQRNNITSSNDQNSLQTTLGTLCDWRK